MGFKRFLIKTLIPGYNYVDTAKKIYKHGLVDGVKEKIREDFLEDTPGISHAYNAGKYEGKKEGYVEASFQYEDKLLRQAEEFLKQTKDFESQKVEYEKLIDDYEEYIEAMSTREDLSSKENEYLQKIIVMEKSLKKAM
ncbi:hypothetical protein ACPUYX_17610 [Desulfosporosinus sp. SYSU MS00001]|uniref:hypothetical protein n=1 Tax=Desulfosporosinus sp. SYSU MS00001 TaxID=3416284 RepID=UPI003CE92674